MNYSSYRNTVYVEFLDLLTEFLNRTHCKQWTRAQWGLVIGPWLLHYINVTHYLHTRFKESGQNPQDLSEILVPLDYLSSNLLWEDKRFCDIAIAMYSGRALVTQDLRFKCDDVGVNENKTKLYFKKLLSFLGKGYINRLKVVLIDPLLSPFQILFLFFISLGTVAPVYFNRFKPAKIMVNRSLRQWHHYLKDADDYRIRLHTYLLWHIPYVYIEGFPELLRSVPKCKAKVLFSSMGWSMNERMKVLASQMKSDQGILIGAQHGGGPYGVSNANLVDQEIDNLDLFLSWGWSGKENIMPFGSIRLANNRKRQRLKRFSSKQPSRILYVGTSFSKYAPNGLGLPSADEFSGYYFDWQKRFLLNLKHPQQIRLTARLYPSDHLYGWDQAEKIRSLKLPLQIDSSGSFTKIISNYGLIVCDSNFTTFFESMSLNKPTVLFFNTKYWHLNKKASEIYALMRCAGIFHLSPESAANHMNKLGNEYDRWWNSREVQNARTEFIQNYACDTPNIPQRLHKIFNRYTD